MNKRSPDKITTIAFIALIVLDAFVWRQMAFAAPVKEARAYFLDVGQGDAGLFILPGNVKILTDAGPDQKISRELEKIISVTDRYIDLAVISHPQLDHFNGFNFLLERYRFGAFISNGRSDSPGIEQWQALLAKIKEQKIPLITIAAKDSIRYLENQIDFLSPDNELLQSAELNDTGLVELAKIGKARILLTADIDSVVENYLVKNFELQADILKVAHHGSKYSSDPGFLKAVDPKLAVVEVGSRNSYGHPAPETLTRLAAIGAKIFRTDQNGTIAIFTNENKLKVMPEK